MMQVFTYTCARNVFRRSLPVAACRLHTATQEDVVPKPFSSIPRKRGWPIIGTLPEVSRNMAVAHELFTRRYEELGPIYYENTGLLKAVMITDVDAIQQLLQQEGKYPFRIGFPVWDEYRSDAGHADGLLLTQYEEWQRMRSAVDKPLMKIRTVESYVDEFTAVSTDFINRLLALRDNENRVPRVDTELFNWSLESVGTVLFQKRMGCVSANRTRKTTELIEAVHTMLLVTSKTILFPPKVVKLFMPGLWKKLTNSWDTIFRVAKESIDERVAEISRRGNHDEPVGFVDQILSQKKISEKEALANIAELMTGAVDTTSLTMQFLLYELAKNPDVQEKLREEILSLAPPNGLLTAEQFRECHYLKGVIKETLRLYPIANFLFRTLYEDAVILGYHIPKGTLVSTSVYVLGRLPSLYKDPLKFKPERWLRTPGNPKIHPYAWLPFGVGPRSCIGRRLAEMEMQVVLSQIMQRFRLELANDNLELINEITMHPKDPVAVRFVDRDQ